jgi:hypothetical protein
MNAAGGVRFTFALGFGAPADAFREARISRGAWIILRAALAFGRPFAFAVILRAPFARDFARRFAFGCIFRLALLFVLAFDRDLAFATAVSSES